MLVVFVWFLQLFSRLLFRKEWVQTNTRKPLNFQQGIAVPKHAFIFEEKKKVFKFSHALNLIRKKTNENMIIFTDWRSSHMDDIIEPICDFNVTFSLLNQLIYCCIAWQQIENDIHMLNLGTIFRKVSWACAVWFYQTNHGYWPHPSHQTVSSGYQPLRWQTSRPAYRSRSDPVGIHRGYSMGCH